MKKLLYLTLSLTFTLCIQAYASPHHIEIMPWSMFQANSQKTGFVDVTLDPKKFKYVWKTYVGDMASSGLNYSISQAMVSGAIVYVSRNNYVYSNTLQAFATLTGRELWKKDFGEAEATQPVAVNGKVYMQAMCYASCYNSHSGLYQYQGVSGKGSQELKFGSLWDYFVSSSYYKGNIYFNNAAGLYSYNVAAKKQDWFINSYVQYVLWSPAVNDKYIVSYADGLLHIIDRLSGTQVASFNNPHYYIVGIASSSAPMLLANNKIITVEHGYLTQYDIVKKAVDISVAGGFTGQPCADNKTIYAIKNNKLVALQRNNQLTQLWEWQPPQYQNLLIQFLNTDNLVILSTYSTVYAIDKTTHKTIWSYPAGGKLSLGMGYLFIMKHSGDLIAIQVV